MKIVFTTFILPHEIDDLERILIGLKKASKFVDGNNYQFNVSIGMSDYLVNWEILQKPLQKSLFDIYTYCRLM